jgi:SAM-dependent methyltransferase
MAIHDAAARGYAVAADAYERARPGYSEEAVARLVAELGIGPESVVAELGAGTGKLTRPLLTTGARVVAVEPVDAMRRIFAGLLPGVPLLGATAEALPLARASVDAVAVGQAFHWFRAETALRETHRVLRPGGRLGLVWNLRDESVAWVAALTRLINAHVGAGPRYQSGAWRKAFETSSLFGPLSAAAFRTEQPTDVEGVVERVASISYIAALPEVERQRVARQVRVLLADHPDTRGRRELVIVHRTDVFWCDRLG